MQTQSRVKQSLLIALSFLALALLFVSAAHAEDAPAAKAEAPAAKGAVDARAIMDTVAEHRRMVGAEAVQTMTIINNKGQERVRKMAMVSKLMEDGKTEKRLVRFLSPADVKGTGLLTYDYEVKDDDMWLFMPALRKTRRLVSSEKSKSFMGSEFSYADMTIPVLDDYTYKYLKDEKADGVDCWVIEITPKTQDIADEDGYSKKVMTVGKADYTLRKGVYYDLEGDLLKEMTLADIRLVDKKRSRYRAFDMQVVNKQNDRKSMLKLDKFELNENAKDEYFTTRYLERF